MSRYRETGRERLIAIRELLVKLLASRSYTEDSYFLALQLDSHHVAAEGFSVVEFCPALSLLHVFLAYISIALRNEIIDSIVADKVVDMTVASHDSHQRT